MNETTCTSGLVKAINRMPGFMALKHNDAKTAGIPDISVTAYGGITWLEVKFGRIESPVGQELMLTKLNRAAAGGAYYVLYTKEGRVEVLTPHERWLVYARTMGSIRTCHDAVCDFLLARHRVFKELRHA